MNLGKTGKDVVTGFTGIITGYVEYLTGCNQYLIVPKCKESGIKPEGHWIDDNRVQIQKNEMMVKLIETNSTGPDKAPHKE